MLREKCNRPMLLIERQRAMLLKVCKCTHYYRSLDNLGYPYI